MRHRTTFAATGNDGQDYTVLVYEAPSNGGDDPAAESLTLRTLEGAKVKRLETGRYQVQRTGVILTSRSPNAP
jgi:hypothetical protein